MAKYPPSPLSKDDDYQNLTLLFSQAVASTQLQPTYLIKNPYEDSEEEEEDPRIMADPAVTAAVPEYRQPSRSMFVTIGSIASFKNLIEEVLSDKFLETLAKLKYDQLIVQCGPDLELFERIRPQKGFDSHWIDIVGFAYTDKIKTYYQRCAPTRAGWIASERGRGIIMAHAGAGTILEALDVDARIIVVPNTSLMDNHQLELAVELDKLGYLRQGHLGQLHQDVESVEVFEPTKWPPKPPNNAKYRHIGDIIDDLSPDSRLITEATEAAVKQMPLEQQMWYDILKGQPFPDGDPRHIFLNGEMTKEKEGMFYEWRANWYAQRRIAARFDPSDTFLAREEEETRIKSTRA